MQNAAFFDGLEDSEEKFDDQENSSNRGDGMVV